MRGKAVSVVSVIYIILGLILVLKPTIVGDTLCYLLALSVGAMGVIYILTYVATNASDRVVEGNNGMAAGIILLILAVFILVKKSLVISLVPFLFGLMITVKGVAGIQHAMNMKRFNVANYKGSLYAGVGIAIFGLVIMMFPFDTVKLFFVIIGLGLVISGVLDLLETFVLNRQVGKEEL